MSCALAKWYGVEHNPYEFHGAPYVLQLYSAACTCCDQRPRPSRVGSFEAREVAVVVANYLNKKHGYQPPDWGEYGATRL